MAITKKKPVVYKKSMYSDVCLGVRKIVKIGNSLGFTVKKSQSKNFHINEGDEYIVVLIKRTWNLSDEMTDSELRQYAKFLKYKKDEDSKIKDAVDSLKNTK